MSIDDLYGERAYLRGRINACEIKINELDKLVKRLEKDIEELKEDKNRLKEIQRRTNIVIENYYRSVSYTDATKNSVSKYYNDCVHTSDWVSRITNVDNLANGYIVFFKKVLLKAETIIKKLEEEIKKKLNSIEECNNSIERTKNEKSDAEADLRRVQYEIDNYDDEE